MSDLCKSPEQPPLFNLEEFNDSNSLLLPEATQRERFTAERVAKNRELYTCITALLGVGYGCGKVAHMLHVSEHTVRSVRDREASTIAGDKERFGQECLRTAAKLRTRVESQVDEMSGKDAAISLGILTEKGLLLTGSATAIVETKRAVTAADVEAAFEKCRRLAALPVDLPLELPSDCGSDDMGTKAPPIEVLDGTATDLATKAEHLDPAAAAGAVGAADAQEGEDRGGGVSRRAARGARTGNPEIEYENKGPHE